MNMLRSAWNTLNRPLVGLVRALVAMVRLIVSGYLAERGRCRAIADLEALPRTVLNDIGVYRVAIPLVVSEASREPRDRVAGAAERQRGGVDEASPAADVEQSTSETSPA